jgi:hypothetical protein
MLYRKNQTNRKLGTLLSVLPSGTGVASIPSVICLANLFPAEFVGNYICMHSDATAHGPGSTGFAAVGSPVTQSLRTNLNGSNCGSCTSQRLNGTADAFKVDAADSPTGDFSVEWTGTIDVLPASICVPIMKWDASAANRRACYLSFSNAGAVSWVVHKTDASSTTVATGAFALTLRARHHIVGTYDYVADGTSVMRLYIDGVEAATASTTAVGPMQVASATPWTFGSSNDAGNRFWQQGLIGQAAITEKVLSAATIATMSQICLGQVKGSRGEAITYTRAGTMTLPTPDGGAMTLQPNKIPVVNGGILIEPAGSNLALQSEGAGVVWFTSGTGTITNDTIVAPDGTLTADVLTDSNAAFSEYYAQIVVTATQSKYTFSCWVKSPTLTSCKLQMAGIGNAAGDVASAPLTISTSWQRLSLTTPAAYGAGLSSVVIDVETSTATDQGDLHIWGCQLEASPVATSYMRSGAGAGSRSAPVCTVANPLVNAGIDPAATNIIKQSQTFGTAPWFKAAANGTLTENAVVAPDGTTTADRLQDSANLEQQSLYQLATNGTATYTASVYAKAGTASWVAIHDTGSAHVASFNVSTGTVGSVVGAGTTSTITPAGNGFYRCTMTAPLTAATYMDLHMGDTQAHSEAFSYVGTGTNVSFWGFQLETGSVATRYIPTTTATVARAAYAPYEWSIGATVNPTGGSWTAFADNKMFVTLNAASGGNSSSIYVMANGKVEFVTRDSNTDYKYYDSNSAISNAARTVYGCNKAGNLTVFVDGVSVPITAISAVGTGFIATQGALAGIGMTTAGAGQPLAVVSNIIIKNKGTP